jgi:hypothetical protein
VGRVIHPVPSRANPGQNPKWICRNAPLRGAHDPYSNDACHTRTGKKGFVGVITPEEGSITHRHRTDPRPHHESLIPSLPPAYVVIVYEGCLSAPPIISNLLLQLPSYDQRKIQIYRPKTSQTSLSNPIQLSPLQPSKTINHGWLLLLFPRR